jgi:hypothetical protein
VTVAESDRNEEKRKRETLPTTIPDPGAGHPSFEQLMAEQGTAPIADVGALHGDFWPAEESVEEFLATLDEWRCRKRIDPAA